MLITRYYGTKSMMEDYVYHSISRTNILVIRYCLPSDVPSVLPGEDDHKGEVFEKLQYVHSILLLSPLSLFLPVADGV